MTADERLKDALLKLITAMEAVSSDEDAHERRLWNEVRFQKTERLHRKYEKRR